MEQLADEHARAGLEAATGIALTIRSAGERRVPDGSSRLIPGKRYDGNGWMHGCTAHSWNYVVHGPKD